MSFMPLCLLEIASEGERQFIEKLYIEHYPMMYRYAMRCLHHREDVEDVIIDSCIALSRHIHKLQAMNAHAHSAYILSTVRNASLMLLRRRKTEYRVRDQLICEAALHDRTPDDEIETEVIRRCTLARVTEALSQLSEMNQLLLRMKYFEHASDHEIGQLLGLHLPAVRSRILRARRKLYEILRAQDEP